MELEMKKIQKIYEIKDFNNLIIILFKQKSK